MQKDPQGAMERFGGNPEFRELLLEFSKIMGSHFDTMGKVAADKEAKEKAAQQPPRDPKAEVFLFSVRRDVYFKLLANITRS